MKVRIDCDKRRVSRNSDAYEGGWFHYTVSGERQDIEWKSERRWTTYAEAKQALIDAGHEFDNAGWKHRLLSWQWHAHGFDGYPGWEIEKTPDGSAPAFVELTHRRGKEGSDVESHVLCAAWDDIAEHDFYQRDRTDSGIPYCHEGEVYWSGWWFATATERDRFVAWFESRVGR